LSIEFAFFLSSRPLGKVKLSNTFPESLAKLGCPIAFSRRPRPRRFMLRPISHRTADPRCPFHLTSSSIPASRQMPKHSTIPPRDR
jgi:hypothetical protein